MMPPREERIQKILAAHGYGSRRQVEAWLKASLLRVNGKVAQLGQRITRQDRVSLDNKVLKITLAHSQQPKIIALYKQLGQICSRKDSRDRPTVFNDLPFLSGSRWINIGRLDINTSGLLLFTNDGDWAHRLMHPSSSIEREYAVRVYGKVDKEKIKALLQGVELDGRLMRFSDIVQTHGRGMNCWYYVVLMEGCNREVRRLWQSQGVQVSRLIRVRYGCYILPRKKRPGACWKLTPKEVTALLDASNREIPR